MYEIKKGVEVKGSGNKYPLSDMEVGDMFEFEPSEKIRGSIMATVYHLKVRNKIPEDAKFITRKISEDKFGCWRIK